MISSGDNTPASKSQKKKSKSKRSKSTSKSNNHQTEVDALFAGNIEFTNSDNENCNIPMPDDTDDRLKGKKFIYLVDSKYRPFSAR